MILELKPEQQRILELATQSGMTQEEVVERAFEIIRDQHGLDELFATNREEIAAHIEQGYAEALRGELLEPDEVKRILLKRRQERKTA